jgi:transcriptional regulator with XRE-family HTH domain
VKDRASTGSGRRVDPEEQAGKALRQLRQARNWSQQEVAVRMAAFGYDFHQTTIAKIEAAQRPLRVRELADFAALYGVGVQELVYASALTLTEIDQVIEEVEVQLRSAQAGAAVAAQDVAAARTAARDAEMANQAALANITVLAGRLDALKADREKLRGWNADSDSVTKQPDIAGTAETRQPEVMSVTSAAEDSPNVLRILFGSHLRRLRESNGIPAEQAARTLDWTTSRISRLELGQAGILENDLADLLALYDVTDAQERLKLFQLSRKSNAPSWWRGFSDILPSWFELYIGLEAAAAQIKIFEAGRIPDLLQTNSYSRAVNSRVHKYDAAEDVNRRVQLRAARRERLLDRPNAPRLQVVLDEAVLLRQVGGEAVMREQLKYLINVAGHHNNKIQVLPLAAGITPTQESFQILHFSGPDIRDVVYLEWLQNAHFLDKDQEVDSYISTMHQLTSRALSVEESVLFLQKTLAAKSL